MQQACKHLQHSRLEPQSLVRSMLQASQAPRLLQVIALLQKIGHDLQSANSAATFSNPASHKAIQEFLARVRQASNPSALAELLDAALDGANEEVRPL